MSVCRKCSVELVVGETWGPGSARKNDKICRPCCASKVRAYAATIPEKISERRARYHEANKERENAYSREYRSLNRDRCDEITRQWHERNREHVRARQKAYVAANPGVGRQAKAEWAKRNPDKVRAQTAKRRARRKDLTPPDADMVKIREFYTLAETLTRVTGKPYHVDHIKSLKVGGPHHQDNLVVMAAPLNLAKGAQHWPWLTWFNAPSD